MDQQAQVQIVPQETTNKQLDTSNGVAQATQEDAVKKEVQSTQLAQLARKEKILRAQQRAIAEEKKAIESQRQSYEQIKADLERERAWKSRLAEDPYGTMLEAGLTSDQVTSKLLNGQPDPRDQELTLLKRELQAIKQSQENSQNKFNELQSAQYEAAKKQIRSDVQTLVSNDPQYEMVKSLEAQESVVEYIEELYNKTGNLISIDEAAKEIENYLIDEAIRVSKLNKIQERLKTLAPAVTEDKTPQDKPISQKTTQNINQPNTLSNRIMQQAGTSPKLSEKERRERAMRAFYGQTT